MSEPMPLRTSEITAFERELLEAARAERPPAELTLAMEQALGLGSAVAGPGAAGAASVTGSAGFWGYAAIAGVVLAGAGAALLAFAPASPPAAVRPAAPAVQAAVVTPQAAPATPSETGVAPAPIETSVSRPMAPAAPVAVRAPVARPAANPLRDEIRLIDEARAALRGGDSERSLSSLERHARQFPRGALRQEAAVLRVQALDRLGQRGRASSLARDFLKEHPESPHSERVRTLAPGAK